MIFDIVENIMEWTVPNENRMWKMYRRVFLKKKQSVSGQFTAVKYRSEKYYWTQKSITGRESQSVIVRKGYVDRPGLGFGV